MKSPVVVKDTSQIDSILSKNQQKNNKFTINLSKVSKKQSFQSKATLQILLDTPLQQKTRHTLKQIKKQIKKMNCFKALINQQPKNKEQIIFKDSEVLINLIAMYGQTKYCKKGTIAEATAVNRQTIKILISGKVGVFQPTTSRSFVKCYQKCRKHELKHKEFNMLIKIINQKKQDFQTKTWKQLSKTIWLIDQDDPQNNQQISQNQNFNNSNGNFINNNHSSINAYNKSQNSDNQDFYKLDPITPPVQLVHKQFGSSDFLTYGKKLKQRASLVINHYDQDRTNFSSKKQKYESNKDLPETSQNDGHQKISLQQIKSIILEDGSISQDQALQLINWSNLNSKQSPHRFTKIIQSPGYLISACQNDNILTQLQKYESSMICMNDSVFLEIQFNVFKQILVLISNNQEKPYIRMLLKKFQFMDYYEAKKYVNNSSMIDKLKIHKSQKYQNIVKDVYGLSKQEKQLNKKITQIEDQDELNSPSMTKKILKIKLNKRILQRDGKLKIKTIKEQNFSKDSVLIQNNQEEVFHVKKNLPSQQYEQENPLFLNQVKIDFLSQNFNNLTYDIPFQNQVYLIIAGEVTLKIDTYTAYRISEEKNANLKKKCMPKSLLKLYANDMFGFQNIGNQKQFNLRYEVKMNSKILKMDQRLIQRHFQVIRKFKQQIKFVKKQRNDLIKIIVQKIERNVQKKLIQKYLSEDIPINSKTNRKSQVIYGGSRAMNRNPIQNYDSDQIFKQKKKQIREIQFMGRKSFDQLQDNLVSSLTIQRIPKNHNKMTLDLIKQFRKGVEFVSQLREKQGKTVFNEYVEMRGEDGHLIRRKSIPVVGSKHQIQNIVLKKIGVLNQKQKVIHNLKIVKNRKSVYKFQDLQKEKRQLKRLTKISKSLPKMNNFYAKSHNLNFRCVHPGKILLF